MAVLSTMTVSPSASLSKATFPFSSSYFSLSFYWSSLQRCGLFNYTFLKKSLLSGAIHVERSQKRSYQRLRRLPPLCLLLICLISLPLSILEALLCFLKAFGYWRCFLSFFRFLIFEGMPALCAFLLVYYSPLRTNRTLLIDCIYDLHSLLHLHRIHSSDFSFLQLFPVYI